MASRTILLDNIIAVVYDAERNTLKAIASLTLVPINDPTRLSSNLLRMSLLI